jgi:S-adenosylmethionine-diacylgycerolhomoserine-N-methlytransferase
MVSEAQTKRAMNSMYRWTRHIYDASRKYYLLGRDTLISSLQPKSQEIVIEIGCGTARNLIKMARLYPEANFFGFDASDEMLKTARASIMKASLNRPVKVAQAFAQSFDPKALFGIDQPIGKLVFSYALSIIPPWREAIDHGLNILPKGGEMHIVDFGDQAGFPGWFRRFLFWWLAQFHVYHKPEILDYLKRLELEKRGALSIQPLYNGYAYYAVFKKA